MQSFNWLDYAIITLVTLSALISLIRGFIREALSLAGWIIAFWVSLTFARPVSHWLLPYIHSNSFRYGLAFFVLFLLTLLVCAVANFLITRLAIKTGLSGTDRLIGVIFGFIRGILLVAVLLLAAQMTTLPQQEVWRSSKLIPQFASVTKWLAQYIPKDFHKKTDQIRTKEVTTHSYNQQERVIPERSAVRKATNDRQMLNQEAE